MLFICFYHEAIRYEGLTRALRWLCAVCCVLRACGVFAYQQTSNLEPQTPHPEKPRHLVTRTDGRRDRDRDMHQNIITQVVQKHTSPELNRLLSEVELSSSRMMRLNFLGVQCRVERLPCREITMLLNDNASRSCSSLRWRGTSSDGLKQSIGWNSADGAWSVRKRFWEEAG